ncbi:MAG: hypothetical protein Q9212_002282 [Teloschistes hypoglaucus]
MTAQHDGEPTRLDVFTSEVAIGHNTNAEEAILTSLASGREEGYPARPGANLNPRDSYARDRRSGPQSWTGTLVGGDHQDNDDLKPWGYRAIGLEQYAAILAVAGPKCTLIERLVPSLKLLDRCGRFPTFKQGLDTLGKSISSAFLAFDE